MSPRRGSALRSLGWAAALVAAALGFRATVGSPLVVESATLSPTVLAGEWVWVWKLRAEARPGDTVWVRWPGTPLTGAYRVIAVGPATVAVSEGGRPVVDGRAASWHETSSGWEEDVGARRVPVIPGGPSMAATKLPEGQLFLLSDARPLGGDSRVHGMIREDAILGAISTSSPD